MASKKEYSVNELETKYNAITKLYDYAEELVSTVESKLVSDAAQQLELVEPLINELGDASDVLTEEFLLIAESKKYKNSNKASKSRIEAAFRRIFAAIHDYQLRAKATSKKASGAIANIADPIVEKIQRHVEEMVVIFLEFVQFSLQSIMGQTALEALRVRDARIALMMHQQALSQQQ